MIYLHAGHADYIRKSAIYGLEVRTMQIRQKAIIKHRTDTVMPP
jgi:glycerol-3-phosphate cytidylyltransferase-like family protein